MVKKFSLSKNERLSGGKVISSLFETGQTLYSHPVRILFQEKSEEPGTVQMAVSVPKRLFRRAVDRNLLKRRIREAYRLNKSILHKLIQQRDKTLVLVIQYQHKAIESYQVIEEGLIRGLSKLAETLEQRP